MQNSDPKTKSQSFCRSSKCLTLCINFNILGCFNYRNYQLLLTAILAFAIYTTVVGFLITGFVRADNRRGQYLPKVSVIVAARNEASNIERCLRSLAAQTYPRHLMQIVVVNDRSGDATGNILDRHRTTSETSMVVKHIGAVPQGMAPKKFALGQGIKSANGELIFTTDADCEPLSEWIAETVPLFLEEVGVVIGPAPLQPTATLLEKLLSLDTFATALVAAGAAGWNVGVTCTGRNLAYRKKVFDDVGGFAAIQHSLSGDDDLFLQLVKKRTRWRVRYSINPKTAVPSPPPRNFSNFIAQRRRHVSASKFYSKPIQAGYLAFNLSNLTLFAFLIYGIMNPGYLAFAITLFCAKLVLDFVALFVIVNKFTRLNLLSFFLMWEFFFLINQVVISPFGLIGRIKWK